jgi:hypothetical protein
MVDVFLTLLDPAAFVYWSSCTPSQWFQKMRVPVSLCASFLWFYKNDHNRSGLNLLSLALEVRKPKWVSSVQHEGVSRYILPWGSWEESVSLPFQFFSVYISWPVALSAFKASGEQLNLFYTASLWHWFFYLPLPNLNNSSGLYWLLM